MFKESLELFHRVVVDYLLIGKCCQQIILLCAPYRSLPSFVIGLKEDQRPKSD